MRYWPIVACVVCLLLGGWIALRFSRWLERRRGRARTLRGQRGEHDAERILIAQGYRIHSRQHRIDYTIEVNGAPQNVALILDFVVEKNGERVVAEVKTGESAPLSRAETRRQLLEYQLATQAHRVLLVDPEAGTITDVAFPIADQQRDASASPALVAIGTLVAIALACWWWGLKR